MTETHVKEKVTEILANQIGVDSGDITPADRFKADLHMNAIDLTDFANNLLNEGFDIIPEEISNYETVGELIEILSEE